MKLGMSEIFMLKNIKINCNSFFYVKIHEFIIYNFKIAIYFAVPGKYDISTPPISVLQFIQKLFQ